MALITQKRFIVFLLVVSLFANVVLAFLLVRTNQQLTQASQTQKVNLRILSFTNLFIEQVLMSSREVDFNTRLTLETMVRNLNDKDILAQWKNFTQAPDAATASTQAKKLLDLLIKKISY